MAAPSPGTNPFRRASKGQQRASDPSEPESQPKPVEGHDGLLAQLFHSAGKGAVCTAQLDPVGRIANSIEACAQTRGDGGIETFDPEADGDLAGRRVQHRVGEVRGIDGPGALDQAGAVELRDAVKAAVGCADGDAERACMPRRSAAVRCPPAQVWPPAEQPGAAVKVAQSFLAEKGERDRNP